MEEVWHYNAAKIIILDSAFFSGVSLGRYILLNKMYSKTDAKHEYGHTIQGFIFGSLYLFFIGIPSVVNNLLARVNRKIRVDYYRRYPENWVDKLGGVRKRDAAICFGFAFDR